MTSSSYAQVLRSSAVTGGVAILNVLISMVSVKFGAVLLGPTGVGRLRMLQSIVGLATSVTTLGIPFSAVQAVAQASAESRESDVSALLGVVRRLGWILGIVGWISMAALAWPISRVVFGDSREGPSLVVLGVTLLFSALCASMLAPFQGFRRIGDLAAMSLFTALVSTTLAIGLFAALGESGIVPALIASGATSVVVPLLFRRRQPRVHRVHVGWRELVSRTRKLAAMGISVTAAGLCSSLSGMAVPGLITRELGVESTGLYMAGWGISGLFANFILSAMVTDYFPRLSAVVSDAHETNRLVNEQTEIGVLLALPGVVATVGFGQLAISLFYSAQFHPASDVLLWLSMGVFGRVTSYPLGYLMLAHRASKLFVVSEVLLCATQVGLAWIGIRSFGLEGAGAAFLCAYTGYTAGLLVFARTRFRLTWRRETIFLVLVSAALIAITAIVQRLVHGPWTPGLSFVLAVLAAVISLRGLMRRLGTEHKLYRLAARIPGMQWRI